MYIKKINQFLVLLTVSLILSGCVVKDGKIVMKNKKEPFKHNTPLIKVDMKKSGKENSILISWRRKQSREKYLAANLYNETA